MRKPGSIKIDGKKLREMRLKRAMTQDEFGRAIGISGSRVTQLEKAGAGGVYPRVIRKVSELIGEPIERVLITLAADAKGEDQASNVDMSSMQPVPEIPTFELRIACGPWTEVGEVAELRDPRQIDDGRFRIRAHGDSMEPDWPNGSLIEFRCLRWGLDPLEVGEDYYVQVDENATFKRLEKAEEDTLIFRAINRKKYGDPMPVARGDVVRMAKAEWLLSRPRRR